MAVLHYELLSSYLPWNLHQGFVIFIDEAVQGRVLTFDLPIGLDDLTIVTHLPDYGLSGSGGLVIYWLRWLKLVCIVLVLTFIWRYRYGILLTGWFNSLRLCYFWFL